MSGIFINYRHEDSAAAAHTLFASLSSRFHASSVFIDVEAIEPGESFPEVIDEKVGFCDVLIAVIGPNWLASSGADGRRRLDDPQDWVSLEIAAALTRKSRVIPVLIGGARMPDRRELPEPLAPLADYQAVEIRAEAFEEDTGRLVAKLESVLKAP